MTPKHNALLLWKIVGEIYMHYHIDMITHGMAFVKQLGSTGETRKQHAGRGPPFWNQRIMLGSNLGGSCDKQNVLVTNVYPKCLSQRLPLQDTVLLQMQGGEVTQH